MANGISSVDKLIYELEMLEHVAPEVSKKALASACRAELEKVGSVDLVRWLAGEIRADCGNRQLVLLAEAGLVIESICVWGDEDA